MMQGWVRPGPPDGPRAVRDVGYDLGCECFVSPGPSTTRFRNERSGHTPEVWRQGTRWVAAVVALLIAAAPPVDAGESRIVRRALVIGITDYAGRTTDTVGGRGDAEDVHLALRRAGFRDADVRVLVDGAASAAAIRDGIRWLTESSSASTFSVFHYSGHVKQLGGDRDHDGEDLDEFLWAADNGLISDGELASSLRRLRGRAWIDIAGCEAAGFDDGLSSPQRLFTASSAEPEKSYEHPEWRNSIFVGLLVDRGMLQRRADGDDDGRVSIQEAFTLAAREAPRLTTGQPYGPQHPVLTGGDKYEWYLDEEPSRCLLLCG